MVTKNNETLTSTDFEELEWLSNWTATLIEDDLSENTRKSYIKDVQAFLGWMRETIGDPHPTFIEVAQYRDYLMSQDKSPATINRMLASCKRFMRWAVDAGIAQSMGKAKSLKDIPAVKPALNRALTIRLMNRVNRDASPRDRAVIMLALGVGLRASEIASLKIKDCVLAPGRIDVNVRFGKGRVSRRVRGGDKTREAVVDRIKEIEDALTTGSPYCRDRYTSHDAVLSRAMAQYDPSSEEDPQERLGEELIIGVLPSRVGEIVTHWGLMAEIKGLHPHMLRRTYAQIRRASGVELERVARELGHSSPDTTVRYTISEEGWDVVSPDYL